MSIRRLRTPKIKINRVIEKQNVNPTRKIKVSPLDKYTWKDYYAERNYYYGGISEAGTDE